VSLRVATNDCQKLPEEHEEVLHIFRQAVQEISHMHGVRSEDIWNMDQTMVRFDNPSTRTNNNAGDSQIRIVTMGVRKKGFTVALCASASGEKMPAYIIFKESSGGVPLRALASLSIPPNVVVEASTNGWMTNVQLEKWINGVWRLRGGRQRILLLDQYKPHHSVATTNMLSAVSTMVVGIPGGRMYIYNRRVHATCSTNGRFNQQTLQGKHSTAVGGMAAINN
jgi:hypothetical protein